MNTWLRFTTLAALAAVVLVGCAHTQRGHVCCSWQEDQLADYRKAAIEAAASPEQWRRVGKRLTLGPLKLETSALAYQFYCGDQRMDMLIPTNQSVQNERTGERISTKVRVTLDAGTALIISMKEEAD
jgi:hypothetical protein